jgi:ubiquinone/menaquinone biosynthesis C-methylase UbiE
VQVSETRARAYARHFVVVSVTVCLCAAHGGAQTKPKVPLFPPQDLGLLEAPDRERWSKPDLIMDKLKIADSAAVADIGAGSGWFTIRLARRVGPAGVVYAEDVQRQMIELIGRRIQRENLPWVKTVLGTVTDPKLPSGLDAVLLVNTFREMDDPAHPEYIVTLLQNVLRVLNPRGCVGVVDFLPGGGGPGPAPDERVAPEEVIDAAAAAGLKLLSRDVIPPFIYLLIFGSDTSRCASS